MQGIFKRTELLLGDTVMEQLAASRVIIFGVGGVGSWCAESLVRSGITQLTIVDSDRICVTNVNRQLMATSKTVGKVKVDVLRDRLLEINPKANITALQKIYCAETKDDFAIETYDYIIDAIDSLQNKVLLIQEATRTSATFFSSMGAALKIDATKIQVTEFWKVKGCTLASALRQRFRKIAKETGGEGQPAKKFLCIFSEERLDNKGATISCGTAQCLCPRSTSGDGDPSLLDHEWCSSKAQINGTVAHITAIFGFMLAGLVVEDINNVLMCK
ncbi:MAG: tRNA threonylcarbamoyladenosine dehydratase [Dysgonamonadaceae bacterium]|jgi:tRNA A37 threonylcarbamoyladenosine dehydratase|nr:tRNA threonylcarbamoyladenosine dehydratase [Dysgonamonadaceae bacterium]